MKKFLTIRRFNYIDTTAMAVSSAAFGSHSFALGVVTLIFGLWLSIRLEEEVGR